MWCKNSVSTSLLEINVIYFVNSMCFSVHMYVTAVFTKTSVFVTVLALIEPVRLQSSQKHSDS